MLRYVRSDAALKKVLLLLLLLLLLLATYIAPS